MRFLINIHELPANDTDSCATRAFIGFWVVKSRLSRFCIQLQSPKQQQDISLLQGPRRRAGVTLDLCGFVNGVRYGKMQFPCCSRQIESHCVKVPIPYPLLVAFMDIGGDKTKGYRTPDRGTSTCRGSKLVFPN